MADGLARRARAGAKHVFGAPMQKVFSLLSFFKTAYLDLDMPGEEFNALFSFEEAVDKLHVADADAARPATSASAGLTSATATARPPGAVLLSLLAVPRIFSLSPHSHSRCCSLLESWGLPQVSTFAARVGTYSPPISLCRFATQG